MQGAVAQRMIRSVGFRQPKGFYANVSNRERQRVANRMIAASQQAMKAAEDIRLILLAVLGQSGGEITVTDGTLQQIAANLKHMDYAIVPGEKPGESIVRLVEGKDEPLPTVEIVDPNSEVGQQITRNGATMEPTTPGDADVTDLAQGNP